MNKTKHVLIIPGLGDKTFLLQKITNNWTKKYNLIPHVVAFGWKNNNQTFDEGMKKLNTELNNLYTSNGKIILIGTSAGGSAAINLYIENKEKVEKVINVCGRLIKGENVKPTLEESAKNSKSFYKSVLTCEENLKKLTKEDKEKILNIAGLYDEIVPTKTTLFKGMNNKRVFSVFHATNITNTLTIYSKVLIRKLHKSI